MRSVLIFVLLLASGATPAGAVSISCEGTPAAAVIADLASQSGKQIVLAVETDARVTAKLADVSIDEALEVISGLCGGAFIKTDSGYRVYPRPPAETVLSRVRGAYSKVRDLETTSESVRTADSKTTSKGRTWWKSPGLQRSDLEFTSGGKASRTVSVVDGQYRWSWQLDSCEAMRNKLAETMPGILRWMPVGLSGPGIAALSEVRAEMLPGLQCGGVEILEGRPVFTMQYEFEPSNVSPSGKSGMAAATGFMGFSPTLPVRYSYEPPVPKLDPAGTTRIRFGVDADTGLVVYGETTADRRVSRQEASDIREAAPGIPMAFRIVTRETEADGESERTSDVRVTMAKVNSGPDDNLFVFQVPADVFVSDGSLDLKACEEALKSKPDDPDLIYRHAQLLGPRYGWAAWADCVAEYERALALRPAARSRTIIQVLQAAVASMDTSAVLKYIEEVGKLSPSDRETRFAIARAWRSIDRKSEALEELGRICASYEDRSEAPLDEVASLCRELGDTARAERLCLEAMKISIEPRCISAAQCLRQICADEKKLQSLRAPLEAAVKRFPGSADLRYQFGLLLSQLNEPDAAMAVFRELARTSKSGSVVSQAVRQLKSGRNYGSAREIAETFLAREDGARDKGAVLSQLMDILMVEGIPVDTAVALYKQCAGPGDSSGWSLRAMFTDMKVLPEAIEEVMKGIRAEPSDTRLVRLLIDLVSPTSDSLDNAKPNIAAMQQLIAAMPDQAPFYGILGAIHMAGKDYPEAARAFRKGIELAPDQPYYYAQLGYVYNLAGEHEKASEIGRQLVEKDPERHDFRCVLGSVLANAGKYDEAVVQLRKADELLQGLPVWSRWSVSVLDALILCYNKLNDTASVEQCMLDKVDRSFQDWERANGLQQLAVFYAKQDQHGKAVEALLRIEEQTPKKDLARVGFTIQNCRWQLNQEKRADFAKALDAALANKPGLLNCRMLLAGLYIDLQNAAAARRLIEALAADAWDDETMLSRIAALAGHNTSYGDMTRVYSRLIVLNPENASYEMGLAQAYQQSGMREKAVEIARKVLLRARNEPSGDPNALASAAYRATVCAGLFQSNDLYEEAIDAYNAATELKPDSWDEHELQIAGICTSREDQDGALVIYERVARESGNIGLRVQALSSAASLYENRRQKEKAVECHRKVLSIADQEFQKENARRQIERLTAPPREGSG